MAGEQKPSLKLCILQATMRSLQVEGRKAMERAPLMVIIKETYGWQSQQSKVWRVWVDCGA
jgi:hypothetical protein